MEFLLTIIVIFVAVSWVLGKLLPRILTWYLTKKVKNMQNNFYGGAAKQAKEEEIKKSKEQEGTVRVTRVVRQDKIIDSTIGEYIDYESVNVVEEDKTEN